MGGAPCVLFVFGVRVLSHVGKEPRHRSREQIGKTSLLSDKNGQVYTNNSHDFLQDLKEERSADEIEENQEARNRQESDEQAGETPAAEGVE